MMAWHIRGGETALSEMIYILAASYDRVEDALADYEAIDGAYRHFASSHDFDATVVAKDETGKVDIVRRHDEPTRRSAGEGFGWGMAAGAVAALFPAIGILGALAAGGGAGAALGALAGHAARALSRDDLKLLGEVLDRGDAGLVVVYGPDMADRVATSVTRSSSKVNANTNVSAEQLAEEVRAAQAAGSATPQPG
jgi:uncharacterized membrane protein